MNCRDFQEIIDSYLSDELLTETNHDVLRHLENCVACRSVIEARRNVRQHLKSAVFNAPQYQIGKNFTHNLRTQLRHEAFANKEEKATSRFRFGSLIAVAAGLILTLTFGFIFLNDSNSSTIAKKNSYQTEKFPSGHLVNVAFGDHEHCAVKRGTDEPVKAVETPAKYEQTAQIAMPQLKNILADYNLKSSHTCEYKNTKFTHLIIEKDNEILSVMLTEKAKAENLSEGIAHYSSEKYQMDRFDVNDTAVFVVSNFDEQINSKAAQALYQPLQKYLNNKQPFETALLMFY